MTCDHLTRLLALYLLCCALTPAAAAAATDFLTKAQILLEQEPDDPKCFASSPMDFTCFWAEEVDRAGALDQYSFTYSYQEPGGHEPGRRCPLRTVAAADGRRLFVCHLDETHMFVDMDIRVHRAGKQIHNRSLLVERNFLLDPPTQVRVNATGQQGQLQVTWLAPPLKYRDDSMMYQVGYEPAHGGAGQQVEEVRAETQVILRRLRPGTRYRVRVRVTLDGISFSGYWSAWSPPVTVETPAAEFDPLILSLSLVISFILIVTSLIIVLSHRRFLTKKIWPTIPTPDGKFQGLFTVYGGNFEEWLGQTNGGLWVTPAFFYSEERPSALEVLSDLGPSPAPPSPAPPPRAPRGSESSASPAPPDERWLMEHLRGLGPAPPPSSRSSPLESQDAYVTLSDHNRGGAEPLDDILEERAPLEVLFAARKTALGESHSDLVSGPQSSGSGRLSSQSSFEYPNQAWAPKGPGYAYMAVADSGVSMDYSPMSRADDKLVVYANDYRNEIPPPRRALLTRQHLVHEDS